MDAQLTELMRSDASDAGAEIKRSLRILRDRMGVVELSVGGETREYSLKPMQELFGAGIGGNVDPQNQAFLPLFLGIEEAIQWEYREDRGLTDGAVRLALMELTMNPAAETRDGLALKVQEQIRLILSLNDYSRDEVKGAVRKILKSVERNTKSGGPRGYLEFVRKMFRM